MMNAQAGRFWGQRPKAVGRERNDPPKPSPERERKSLRRFLASDLWISSLVGFPALLIDVDSRKRVGGLYPVTAIGNAANKNGTRWRAVFDSQFTSQTTSSRTTPNWLR